MALSTERQKIAHLLRRAGFGAGAAELAIYEPLGFEGSLDRLINYEQVDEDFALEPWDLRPKKQAEDGKLKLPAPLVAYWWGARMALSQRPLQEKLTLFWHDHFGCSAEKVKQGRFNLQHNGLLRRQASGNFRSLLQAVAKDPTMLLFLDTGENRKGQPNENFARELLELYTLGIGNYSERDVQEAARAFTGWTIQRAKAAELEADPMAAAGFRFRRGQHDEGAKTVLGQNGNFGGEDVINLLCDQPQCQRYICTKLWSYFAYPNPEPQLIERLASIFADNKLELKPLLRAIFSSEEFYSERAERALFKSPADFVLGVLRACDLRGLYAEADGAKAPPRPLLALTRLTMLAMRNQGLALLFPPSVAGWDWGSAWVNSATMVERIKFADLFGEQGLAPQNNRRALKNAAERADERESQPGEARQARRAVPPKALLGTGSYADSAALAAQVMDALDAPDDPLWRAHLQKEVVGLVGSAVNTPELRREAVHITARLLFASPEFQLL
jgi:uncharacterized protein (DUF1800 family)